MLFDADLDFGLLLLQLARFLVVFVLRNPPLSAVEGTIPRAGSCFWESEGSAGFSS